MDDKSDDSSISMTVSEEERESIQPTRTSNSKKGHLSICYLDGPKSLGVGADGSG